MSEFPRPEEAGALSEVRRTVASAHTLAGGHFATLRVGPPPPPALLFPVFLTLNLLNRALEAKQI